MPWEDNDEDFDFDNENMNDKEKEQRIKQDPLFKKAEEIYELVSALIESLPEKTGEMYGPLLYESSIILAPKIAGAIASESWLLSMQNAAIIRYHAEYLLSSMSGIEMFGDANPDYLTLLRKEMKEFQTLFKNWIQSVNKLNNDFEDEWGLFVKK